MSIRRKTYSGCRAPDPGLAFGRTPALFMHPRPGVWSLCMCESCLPPPPPAVHPQVWPQPPPLLKWNKPKPLHSTPLIKGLLRNQRQTSSFCVISSPCLWQQKQAQNGSPTGGVKCMLFATWPSLWEVQEFFCLPQGSQQGASQPVTWFNYFMRVSVLIWKKWFLSSAIYLEFE